MPTHVVDAPACTQSCARLTCSVLARTCAQYGAIGWNIPYQWMGSDLRFAIDNLKLFLNEQPSVPWEALNIIISDVIYGGRVTDKQDVRLTRAILSSYIDPAALGAPGSFSYCPQLDDRFVYAAPADGDVAAYDVDTYARYVATFPLIDRPEIFGLHDNANISFANNETTDLLAGILATSGGGKGGQGAGNRDAVIAEVAESILKRCPKVMDIEYVQKTHPVLYEESMNTVLIQVSVVSVVCVRV